MKTVKKTKVRYKRVLLLLLIVASLGLTVTWLINRPITNIYVYGESLLEEQYIIEQAGIENYPSSFLITSNKIETKLKENTFIVSANVYKKSFTEVFIEIEENVPLFYYEHDNKVILKDGTSIDGNYDVPYVVNYITDNCYQDFIDELGKLDYEVLKRIVEIEYKPNEVDDNRFLLSMIDGNYVYINIHTFEKLNRYIDYMINLPKEKGILYLDYGNNFEILK